MTTVKSNLDQSYTCKVNGETVTWKANGVQEIEDPSKIEPASALGTVLFILDPPKEENTSESIQVKEEKPRKTLRRGNFLI